MSIRADVITDSRARIQHRRRRVSRLGLLLILAASATACIFDESDYPGGGRQDRSITAGTVPEDAGEPPPDPTGTATATPDAGVADVVTE